MRLDLTKLQVSAVVAMLRDLTDAEDDQQLLLNTLEGETNLYELVGKLLAEIEEDEGNIVKLAAQMSDRQLRKCRAANRIASHREAIKALLECAQLDKLVLPEATLSVRQVSPKPVVTDEAAVPDDFCKITRRPDMAAIKAGVETGAAIPGVSFDNGGTTLTVRRK